MRRNESKTKRQTKKKRDEIIDIGDLLIETPFFVGLVRAGSVDEHLVEN